MADRLDAVPDHVAVAVPDWETAAVRWRDELGGREVGRYEESAHFRSVQYRYANGAKLELLAPPPAADDTPPADTFVRRYLDRFGADVHHLTLKVADIGAAVEVVRAGGLDVVDVDTASDRWKEGFLRPSQVGGIIVQLGWSAYNEEEEARRRGVRLESPPPDAAALLGARLRHPDLDRARRLWELLGGEVADQGGVLVCRWPLPTGPGWAPLSVVVEQGAPAGPVALRVSGNPDLPAAGGVGPRVEGVEAGG
jgi:catechol 2,3-dioxygenase-like lactoylglutathione lyase family enzyme